MSAPDRSWAIEEYPTDNGPADYAMATGGTLLGVVEAKRLTLGGSRGAAQAERYTLGLQPGLFDFNGFRAPFLNSTNGEVIWFHDVRDPLNCSRKIAAFHRAGAVPCAA